MDNVRIFSGNGSDALATAIVDILGFPLGKMRSGRFSDGEIHIEIEENVRGKDVYVIQSTSKPCNDHLMELVIMWVLSKLENWQT